MCIISLFHLFILLFNILVTNDILGKFEILYACKTKYVYELTRIECANLTSTVQSGLKSTPSALMGATEVHTLLLFFSSVVHLQFPTFARMCSFRLYCNL